MLLSSNFSYRCGGCGRCCHDQVITLSPYDLARLARVADLSTAQMITRYTLRRGSLLRFGSDGCLALSEGRCRVHPGRPLACRLYPLGLAAPIAGGAGGGGSDETGRGVPEDCLRFVQLEGVAGSLGVLGNDGSIAGYLDQQQVWPYLEAIARYASLIPLLSRKIAEHADFERIEPREFRRVATREALAEQDYETNRLVDAVFDSDSVVGAGLLEPERTEAHVAALGQLFETVTDPGQAAVAAVLLAVSLGFSPNEVWLHLQACPGW